MTLFLVHHGDAVAADVDARRPLSARGLADVARLAAEASARGVRPAVFWHSGKLRARQTAEAFRSACNPFAELAATRDVQPDDPPAWIRDRLQGEARDVLIAGHFPHLPRLLALLASPQGDRLVDFPLHGIVALTRGDAGETWTEMWRLRPEHDPE